MNTLKPSEVLLMVSALLEIKSLEDAMNSPAFIFLTQKLKSLSQVAIITGSGRASADLGDGVLNTHTLISIGMGVVIGMQLIEDFTFRTMADSSVPSETVN